MLGDSELSLTKLLFLSRRDNHGQSKDFPYAMSKPAKAFSFSFLFNLSVFAGYLWSLERHSDVKDLSFLAIT
jgi:hypothetical protein